MKVMNLIIILMILCIAAGLTGGFVIGSLYQQDRIIKMLDTTAHEDVNILKGSNNMYEVTEVTGTCHNTVEDSYSCQITNTRTGQVTTKFIQK